MKLLFALIFALLPWPVPAQEDCATNALRIDELNFLLTQRREQVVRLEAEKKWVLDNWVPKN